MKFKKVAIRAKLRSSLLLASQGNKNLLGEKRVFVEDSFPSHFIAGLLVQILRIVNDVGSIDLLSPIRCRDFFDGYGN